jgi:hypothetical protein
MTIEAGPTTTKRLVVFCGDKGGVGKSFVARFVAEKHEQHGTGARLIDGDGTTASLSKHFGLPRENPDNPKAQNSANPVRTFALHGTEYDRDTIARLLEGDEATTVLDLPATSLTILRNIDRDYGWTRLVRERGFRPTVVASITPFEESIFDLRAAMDFFGAEADYVAFVNLGTAEDRTDFKLWDGGKVRTRLLEMGGIEVEFPRLKPRVASTLSKQKLTFAAGVKSEHLDITDRSRLAKWISLAEAAIVPAAGRLGLG